MNHSVITTTLLAGALFTQCLSATAAELQPATSQNTFRVMLGATRVIYPEGAPGAQLSVSNPQDRPMLVQSTVTGEDRKTPAPFLVTPPLFRLEANQQSRLRIIRTGGSLPQTRESLFWLCVKALPPSGEASDNASGVSVAVNMAINTCDKLIFRPSGLKGSPEDAAGGLTWARAGKELRVSNPTPFYMNLKAVSVGGKEVGNLTYVPPQGSVTLPLPAGADGAVKWSVINDQGGESRRFEAAAD
ncbi:fimbria/pilus periplasmic chaperone [Pantoea dispersa]|uniref:fimbria/pilus periplasmic chaperone n=1 Tax=Pantoea dispersa TaxID=59814 RepID=UPI000FD7B682|nr:fimbria/pilus periplasmic chaperone [Pantoea dispersa]MCT6592722.1 fimbria/pilus periplasmic chaperone [Pantoea dispersa]MCW0323713.1 Chaperone protein caf1M [Pantoea dispersa]MCW0328449.1 Chaperone protein caf1M [Pantoea dispersa]MCW0434874.1 Chaperone protein caf1M [Pantoea dispersa]RVU72021.1 pili assembly chaperone protein SafB [Pantoea dispersa]